MGLVEYVSRLIWDTTVGSVTHERMCCKVLHVVVDHRWIGTPRPLAGWGARAGEDAGRG